MTWLLGAVLGAGLLLMAAPWLWPTRQSSEPRAPQPVSRLAEAAGVPVRTRVVAAACAACGVVAGAVVWLVVQTPIFSLIALVAGAWMPVLWLRRRRGVLARARRGLWPDVCDHLVASVRAGLSLPEAVAGLSRSAPAPIRPAFAAFARELSATGRFDDAADRLKAALADPVADRIVETLRMARQVGGTELTTVLRGLCASVRQEAALRGEVDARQSWIRGAALLGVIAPWVIAGLLSLRPEGAQAYSSAEGVAVVVVGAAVSVVAYRLMLRVGRLPEPRRWFA